MKLKHILAFLLLYFYTSHSFGNYFNIQVNCHVNNAIVICEACNYSYDRPIFCRVEARGVLRNGVWGNVWQSNIIYSGRCINVSLTSQDPYYNPYVRGSGRANCRF